MAKTIDVIDKKFGKYTVINRVILTADIRYKVRCDCGVIKILDIWDIKNNVHGCRSCRSKMKKKNTKMKNILIAAIALIIFFSSCKTCDPATWESRTKFRSNKSYGKVLSKDHVKTMLVSSSRTMLGYKHIFVTDSLDTIVRFYNYRFKPGCYYLKTI